MSVNTIVTVPSRAREAVRSGSSVRRSPRARRGNRERPAEDLRVRGGNDQWTCTIFHSSCSRWRRTSPRLQRSTFPVDPLLHGCPADRPLFPGVDLVARTGKGRPHGSGEPRWRAARAQPPFGRVRADHERAWMVESRPRGSLSPPSRRDRPSLDDPANLLRWLHAALACPAGRPTAIHLAAGTSARPPGRTSCGRVRRRSRTIRASARAWLEVASVGYLAWRASI